MTFTPSCPVFKFRRTGANAFESQFFRMQQLNKPVHKGLGDMQQLATGVGDLKRVLTNVKTRGVLGEYQ
ncbi:MAG TPA: DNA recombination protein RmuC, partial [Panacibacter sp.]|nr:DNA recombination protein RmuC [Panacibacter sp.]